MRDFEVRQVETKQVHNIDQASSLLFQENKHQFRVLHTNIRSLAKNFTQLQVFLSNFPDLFDSIILTVTWQLPNESLFSLT